MKKLMSLGCLMALVLAGASAFAADWFTTAISTTPTGTGGSWGDTLPALTAVQGGISFNDWNKELVFTAAEAKLASNSNSIIKTTVQFTALDGTDGMPSEMESALAGAKAGLTIVEDANGEKTFWGIKHGGWVALDGNATNALEAAVEVKIEILKDEKNDVFVQYTVNNTILTDEDGNEVLAAPAAAGEFFVQSVSYKGNVPLLSTLAGYAYGNTGAAKEDVVIDNPPTGVPAKIDYNPLDLAARNVDVTNPEEVKAYLTTKRSNGQFGWVNSTLGIDDTNDVVVAGTSNSKNAVTVDFGFAGNGAVSYKVDGATEASSTASINTTASGIHTVEIQVTQNGTTVSVTNQQVGVMNTGKTLTDEEKQAKTELGINKIFDIVAVPFDAFQGEVTVANVLNTAELTEGDMLYVLNGDKYDTYELESGVWKRVGGTTYSRGKATGYVAPEPEDKILTAGQAIWIERNVDSKIVFTGKGETSDSHVWNWTSGEYSLVANPTINDFVLPEAEIGGEPNPANFGKNGDMIIVEDATNPQQFEKKDGVWGEWETVPVTTKRSTIYRQEWKAGGTIKAGIGFWYYNKGASGEVEIDFGTNAR